MDPRVVLVTGVSRFLGGALASILQGEARLDRVIGVDVVPPRRDLGRTEFVRADIRNPVIAKVIGGASVDTVIHLNVIATPFGAGGRAAMKEINVIGTMQLLAACQRAGSVRKLVIKSTTAVYGSSSRDPALFTEDQEPRTLPRAGYAKDAVEVETYVRGFGRRRPDVEVTMLRFANFIGPRIDTPLTRYFGLPVVPRMFGFDPRVQFVHEDDGIELLRRVALEAHPGTFNVAGAGVVLLSQAIRRAGRLSVQVPSPTVAMLGGAFRRLGLVDFSPEQLAFLQFGRVVDIGRLQARLGFTPAYSTPAAFDDYVNGRGLPRYVSAERVSRGEQVVLDLLARRRVHA